MKKKLVSMLVITAMVATMFAGCSKKNDTLIVGTNAGFAPYEYMDEGNKVVGVDMDISKAIADSMGKKLEIKNMDFDAALVAVEKGKVDFVAAGVSVDETRKKKMDFSDDYVNSTEVVVVNKAHPALAEATDKALAGKIVGVQRGNIADVWVNTNVKAKEEKRYPLFSQAAQDLKNQKIDCIVMDKIPAEDLVKANPELSILKETLFEDKYAIAVKKGNKEMLDKINAVIKDLKDSGKMDEFFAKYAKK
jgi:ABC-type amino acid transport/signal transduction systems, periplasmic component/domain